METKFQIAEKMLQYYIICRRKTAILHNYVNTHKENYWKKVCNYLMLVEVIRREVICHFGHSIRKHFDTNNL